MASPKINDALDPELAFDRFKAGDPKPRGLVVFLGLLLLLTLSNPSSSASPGFSR